MTRAAKRDAAVPVKSGRLAVMVPVDELALARGYLRRMGTRGNDDNGDLRLVKQMLEGWHGKPRRLPALLSDDSSGRAS